MLLYKSFFLFSYIFLTSYSEIMEISRFHSIFLIFIFNIVTLCSLNIKYPNIIFCLFNIFFIDQRLINYVLKFKNQHKKVEMVALLWGKIYYTVVFPLRIYMYIQTTTLYLYRQFKQTSILWWSLNTMVLLRNNFPCDQSNVHRWSLCIYLVYCSIVNQFWNKNRLIPIFLSGAI